jgi:hypothetical protein
VLRGAGADHLVQADLALPAAGCPTDTWTEQHTLIAPRAVLTGRAIAWATDALAHDDTTISALARHLRVDWPHPVAGGQGRGDRPHQPATIGCTG